MSNIWNPHAFGVTGQPVGPQVNTLRVYGVEPSKEQLAMAQQTFAKFCMTDRLSFAPNQTQQGFLPDGSKYRIVVVGNTRIMEVRVEGVDAQKDIFSGLLFEQRDAVLVNKGDRGIPSANWERKEPPLERNATGYFPERPPYAFGLCTTNTSYLLPGKMRYMYRGYGAVVGRYGLVTAYLPDARYNPIGVTTDKKKFLILRAVDKLSYCLSTDVDMSKVFLPFGSAVPAELVRIDNDTTTERSISEPDTSHGVHGYMGRASVNRQGNRIVYMERHLGRKATASDVVSNYAYLSVKNPATHSIVLDNPYLPYYGYIVSSYNEAEIEAQSEPIKYFDDVNKVYISRREGDQFLSGSAVFDVPPFECNARKKTLAYFSPAAEQINISGGMRYAGVVVTGIKGQVFNAMPRLEVSDWGDYWYVVGSSVASGPISGTWSRNEKSHDALPHYMGDRLVMLKYTEDRKYEQKMTGSVYVACLDGTFSSGEYRYGDPVWPAPTEAPESCKETWDNTDQEIKGKYDYDGYYTLENGDKFYLVKYRYSETGTHNKVKSDNRRSVVRQTEKITNTLSYTIDNEIRSLLVYDPELDLLCYEEVTYSLERDFVLNADFERYDGEVVKDTLNFTIPPMPDAPEHKLIVKCRGATFEWNVPFEVNEPVELLELLTNTGVSPFASGRDIKTDAGFPGVPVGIGLNYGIDISGGNEDSDHVDHIRFRGLPSGTFGKTRPGCRYIKTPETGAALLTLRVKHGATTWVDESFVVDSAGLRDAVDAVDMSAINPHDDSLEPF